MATVQYRLLTGKAMTAVEGPDDADVVISLDVADLGTDPSVAFMRGKLKAAGHTGVLLDALRSGAVAAALSRLAG